MPTRALVLAALAASLIALAACGGGGGGAKPTSTKAATRTATKQVTRAPATGTPTATETPPASSTPGPSPQPTEAPSPTEPPAAQPTDTPPPSSGGTTVNVRLVEFSVVPSPDSAPAGPVTFDAQNNGTIPHDFLVIKTDLAQDALPVDQSSFTVDTSHLDVLNQPSPINTEDSQQVTLNLASGHYVLICNVATHYQAGMHVSFTVQ
jgi:uncharacterized cupredoxin-like copper-binding protein